MDSTSKENQIETVHLLKVAKAVFSFFFSICTIQQYGRFKDQNHAILNCWHLLSEVEWKGSFQVKVHECNANPTAYLG
jgi:hypothetical protein